MLVLVRKQGKNDTRKKSWTNAYEVLGYVSKWARRKEVTKVYRNQTPLCADEHRKPKHNQDQTNAVPLVSPQEIPILNPY